MTSQFSVRLRARGYEADANGHVAGTVLLQYAQHARWECLRAAGIDQADQLAMGVGPVSLEETIRFHGEVRPGQEIEVSCAFAWGDGKTFTVEHELRRSDGELAAAVRNVGGLLDLKERRLVSNPADVWGSLADAPELLGLS